ncbi:Afadin and alpha-actinin-binding-domain-containing protein [Phascolomyces articulosus]|uniref:Afadin and alpha-actinin-binding-domain-containing protein n=1 Tax=Phascolomyces articulosus TaxID=60185 RepID=A0AAD5K298_9FUNG|nr:Afadin and alpha-actinin-binding-domain-containing protein [Phascolomyces articulosus]
MDDIVTELGGLEPPLSDSLDLNNNNKNNSNDHDAIDSTMSNTTDNNEKDSHIYRFCHSTNIDSAANYINLLLTAEGYYHVPLKFKNNHIEDSCKIINCFEALLRDKKSLTQEVEERNERIRKLGGTRDDLQAQLEKANRDLEEQKRENAQLRAKNESSVKALKKEAEKYRLLNEELSKAKHNMQYMKAQYAHETRKHEQEQAKMRERLYKSMDERYKTNMSSMTINEPLPGIDPYEEPAVSDERTMYTDLLKKSSDREKQAQLENESMRKLLLDTYSTVADLLKRQVENYMETFPTETNRDDLPVLRLPMEIGGNEATKRVQDLLARLREEWDQQITKRKAYSEEDITKKNQVIEQLERSNDELIGAIEGGFFDNVNPRAIVDLSDSESSVLEDIPQETSKFKKLKREAFSERQRATDAAVKLADERAKLSAERWAFEEMKRQLQFQEIMADESPPPKQDTGTRRRTSSYQDQETQERSNKRFRSWLGQAPQ